MVYDAINVITDNLSEEERDEVQAYVDEKAAEGHTDLVIQYFLSYYEGYAVSRFLDEGIPTLKVNKR